MEISFFSKAMSCKKIILLPIIPKSKEKLKIHTMQVFRLSEDEEMTSTYNMYLSVCHHCWLLSLESYVKTKYHTSFSQSVSQSVTMEMWCSASGRPEQMCEHRPYQLENHTVYHILLLCRSLGGKSMCENTQNLKSGILKSPSKKSVAWYRKSDIALPHGKETVVVISTLSK